jgi:hypothetical protein
MSSKLNFTVQSGVEKIAKFQTHYFGCGSFFSYLLIFPFTLFRFRSFLVVCKPVSDMGHFFGDPIRPEVENVFVDPIRPDPISRVVFDQSKRVFSEIKCLFCSFYTSSFSIQSSKIIILSKPAICPM